MRTVQQIVKEKIQFQPFVLEFLADGLLNVNHLARTLRLHIEKERMEKVAEATIAMAIRRMMVKKEKNRRVSAEVYPFDVYLHKNLTLRIFERTTETEKMLQRFSAAQSSEGFLNYSIGITEVSVISSSAMDLALTKMCTIKPRTTIKNTHALTLRYKRSTREPSGVYYRVLKQLAFEDIPILELFSAGEELTLILRERDVARAFTLFNEMQ